MPNTTSPNTNGRWVVPTILLVGLLVLAIVLTWLPYVGLAKPPAGKRQVEVWSWTNAADALSGVSEEFEAEHPDLDIYINKNGSNLQTRLLLALSAGSGIPDVSQLQEREAAKYTRTGRLTDLTDWASPYREQFVPAFWDSCVYEGRMYALPWDVGPCAVYYKRWIFEEYGLDPWTIETWDDFVAMGVELKERSGGKVRMLPLSEANLIEMLQILMQQNGGNVFDVQGRIVLDSPQNRQVLALMRQMLDTGINADLTPYSPEWEASYQTDNVACYPNAVWAVAALKQAAGDTAGKWGVFPMPAFEKGGIRTSNLGGSVLIIPRESEVAEEAWSFIEFANCTVEGQIEQFREQGLFPALITAYDHPYFDEKDPFFADQAVNKVFAQDFEKLPTMTRTADWNEAQAYLGRSLTRWAETRQDNGAYLRGVAEALGRKVVREVVPYEELAAQREGTDESGPDDE